MGIITELDRIIAAIARAHQAVEEMGGNTSVPYLVENLEAAVKSIPKGEDLTAVLNEQTELIAQIQAALIGKVGLGGLVSENWEFTLTDGTVVTKTVYRGDTND